MKLTKKQQEFIKEAATHSDVCENWSNRIKATFPELFNGLKVGKWYKKTWHTDNDIDLFLAQDIKDGSVETNNDNYYRNGSRLQEFSFMNDWHEFKSTRFKITPATDKEVKEALKKEALKKYKIGDVIKCHADEPNNERGRKPNHCT
ncbi:MAG: hypothetical protein GY739_20260, partial [Mesoflavibacter sp.]|nr:hypothetical protein [Mesoflavibacter sp.]